MAMRDYYLDIIKRFPEKKVLVIGDVMLDKYMYGKVSRISPEAPVAVVEFSHEAYMPGGAGNTANNLASLNAHAYLIGVNGNDEAGKILNRELKERKIEYYGFLEERVTNQKTRIIGEKQQIVRVDRE
ncbi:MAG: D-glycero-beta-D-manno-heptose-7-phosphate kinase, partial [Nanoarchaeota archaeon]|nr:D-glycero-beta-D-manno-heptose-7-phosphate kinase [Nanoarchaeota archaeon]